MGSQSNRREESQSKGRVTRSAVCWRWAGSNRLRRRFSSESCLTGSYGGGQPPRMLPTKGARPLRIPRSAVRSAKRALLSRGISIEACWLASRSVSEGWWRWAGSNRRPAAYESAALPTELHRHAHGMYQGPSSTSRVLSTDGRAMTQARGRHNPSISPGS